VPDAQVEREWRIVDACDRLSHAMLDAREGVVLRAVPAGPSGAMDVACRRTAPDAWSAEPWPFTHERVEVRVPGRLLRGRFHRQDALEAAFEAAERVTLAFVVARAEP
jgi:hypothetical protein